MNFKLRFTKDFSFDVEAESLDAAVAAGVQACRDGDVDDMQGDAKWGSEAWVLPDWAQSKRPQTVVVNGKLVHRDTLEEP